MAFAHILTENSLTVFLEGEQFHVDRTSPNWDAIKTALNGTDPDALRRLLAPRIVVEEAVAAVNSDPELPVVDIQIRNGKVYFDGYVVNNELTRRLLDVLNEGLDIDPWIKFAQNLYQNPLETAREEIFEFLSKCDLPITPDGHFLAYKKVRGDYKDSYTGTIDNTPGRVIEMPREQVDPNRFNTCSRGLHFCSKSYLPSFGAGGHGNPRVVVVKINPADVVSIPDDYSNAKGRTWRYEVIGEIGGDAAATKTWRPIDSFDQPEPESPEVEGETELGSDYDDPEDESGATSTPVDSGAHAPNAVDDHTGMEECGYCGGTGKLSETIESTNMTPDELRQLEERGEDECSQCGGEGWVEIEEDEIGGGILTVSDEDDSIILADVNEDEDLEREGLNGTLVSYDATAERITIIDEDGNTAAVYSPADERYAPTLEWLRESDDDGESDDDEVDEDEDVDLGEDGPVPFSNMPDPGPFGGHVFLSLTEQQRNEDYPI